jgi:prepilin-type processing-associated H-X9-DG protein
MGPNVAVALKRIADGTSKTMMIGEIRAGLTDWDIRGTWALGHAGASIVAAFGTGADDNGPNFCGPSGDDVSADVGCGASGSGCPACSSPNPFPEDCMACYGCGTTVGTAPGSVSVDQATVRSTHSGGVYVAMVDGHVEFVTDDIETSGCLGGTFTAWDYLMLSADGGTKGTECK